MFSEHLVPAHTRKKRSWMASNIAEHLIHKRCGALMGRSKNSYTGVGVRVDILLSDCFEKAHIAKADRRLNRWIF